MARNKSNIETIIIALLLVLGAAGALFLFSGSEDGMAEPSHSLENGAAVYQQVSMNDAATAIAE
jgi:flagellar basal body-associated protein FliL